MKKRNAKSVIALAFFLFGGTVSAEKANHLAVSVIEKGEYRHLEFIRKFDDFDGLNRKELRLLRNTLYAKYGYCFESPDLQNHFGKFSWYRCRNNAEKKGANIEKLLTPEEKTNVMILRSLENSLAIEAVYEYEYHTLKLQESGYSDWKPVDMETALTGLWANSFPVGSGYNVLYIFTSDHRFVFNSLNEDNGEYVFGQWKLENYSLYIQLEGGEWLPVSDIRSYSNYWHPLNENAPPRVNILVIKEGTVMHYVNSFYKLN